MISQQVTSDSPKQDGERFVFGYAGYLKIHRNVGDAFSVDNSRAAGERPPFEDLLQRDILRVEHDASVVEREIEKLGVGGHRRQHAQRRERRDEEHDASHRAILSC
jgi:hypothetical protein